MKFTPLNHETLGGAMPAPTARFIDTFEQTLRQIEREAAQSPQPTFSKRRVLAIVLAATLLIAAGLGVAEGIRRGVFDFMRGLYGEQQTQPLPAATDLLRQALFQRTFGHTTVTVREALYDGETLRVVYGLQRDDFAAVLTEAEALDPDGAFQRGVFADGVEVLGGCDWFTIDGVEYGIPGGTVEVTLPGDAPGELLHYVDIKLSGLGLAPTGEFVVGPRALAGETRADQAITFTLTADSAHSETRTATPVTLDGVTITGLSVRLTPLHSYLTYTIDIDPALPLPEADDRRFDWLNTALIGSDGRVLAAGGNWEPVGAPSLHQSDADPNYHLTVTAALPPIADPPAALLLAPVTYAADGSAAADISRAIALER